MKARLILPLLVLLIWSCDKPLPRAPLNKSSSSSISKSVDFNKEIVNRQKLVIDQKLAQEQHKNYELNPLGFYKYVSLKGDEKSFPKIGQIVVFQSEFYTLADEALYPEKEMSAQELVLGQEDGIIGLVEALATMSKGEEAEVILPSYKAYGLMGDGNKIGVNTPLVVKLKLIDIK